MKLVGVEELALVLSRISVVSPLEYGGNGSTRSSSRDLIVDAREVVSQREGSSEPSPL